MSQIFGSSLITGFGFLKINYTHFAHAIVVTVRRPREKENYICKHAVFEQI